MKFPIRYNRAPLETAPLPWREIKKCLVDLGTQESGGPNSLRLNLSKDGFLEIRSTPETDDPERHFLVYISCRAYWTHVLEIYRHARTIEPDLVLFDSQEGVFHDPATFEPLAIAQRNFQKSRDA